MHCPVCGEKDLIKYGFTSSGKQRYKCKCGNTVVYSPEPDGGVSTNFLATWARRLENRIEELEARVKELEDEKDLQVMFSTGKENL